MVVVVLTLMSQTHLRDAPDADGDRLERVPRTGCAAASRRCATAAYVTALAVNLGNGFTSFGLRSAIVPLFVVNALGLRPPGPATAPSRRRLVAGALLLPAGRMTDTRGRNASHS